MRELLDKKTAEVISVLICFVMLLGIGIPFYLETVSKAEQLTARFNLKTAQQSIDAILDDSPGEDAYAGLTAEVLAQRSPGIVWHNHLEAGKALPRFEDLEPEYVQAVHLVKVGPDEIVIFKITVDGMIQYSYGERGLWLEEDTVPYEQGIGGAGGS
ncbi:MAG: hypothetical protein KKB90_04010 [Actinobacteria bacterium]|nr:hypothetical protein [Actinomycetota bacterium]MCG2820014.1 hypothetical protein [Actinomycetes bacterium]MBU4179643.1 hypothetical protein [Actinomycetota bacterium]MBU4218111.1 hypothetical protein [Actinomycetota bacterium]MBU4357716.1 hypothetical protein [Actinomycetota bacterium]